MLQKRLKNGNFSILLLVFTKMALPLHRIKKNDSLAQQVEHIPFKDGVLGSNPRRITLISKSYIIL